MKKQMTQSFKQWKMILFMIMPLLISLACLTPTSIPATTASDSSTAAPESGAVSAEVNVDFGPGPFDFPYTRAGLVDLSSYKATLIMSFDGTRDGQTQKWSKTYVMLSTKEPATLQLTIEKTGDLTDLDPVFMAEADGADYERRGENACTATVIEEGNSLGERLEPAGFLTFVIGAEEAGAETVNDVAANHYIFDERASGQLGIAQSTGEMWVASDGGYIVKYLLTTKGNADYFGEDIEGTLTLNYELTDVNQPVAFALPDDCPLGMVNAPQLSDATNVLNVPGVLAYDTSTSLADTAAFYQEQMPGLGWTLVSEPSITETNAVINFTQVNQNLTVVITTDAGVTTVTILLGKVQE